MFTILYHLKNRYMSQKAQGIVEYALILAFVVALAVVLTSDGGLSGAINKVFGTTAAQINKANAPAN
ncbi:Flp family type IVb pilin [Anaerovibrio sp.]|uniref:Flp family type IVb pilin n=1 Tax=Anaerovibrio sp. TaxID=1872532 RepID=UPI003F1538FF